MLRERGYRITLIFLWLPSVEIALARVSQRVAEGGHDIPKPVVIRRYKAGLRNLLDLYLPVADIALIYDNADSGDVLIAERGVDGQLEVYDRERWSQIEEAAK
ncbi:MAG: hypothetical protein JWN71_3781 [Xanthobacteraceae bacterium]|nr:hypothetical protein [Xanthobacteraceae bacterium]